jgi:MYXO-CTERM domain-containing protein
MKRTSFIASTAFLVTLHSGSIACGASQVLFDQIGPTPATLASSSSSSQFNPATPNTVFATVDNVVFTQSVHLSDFEAAITELQNVISFDLIQSWNVRIYSSLNAASHNVVGDVYNRTFDVPTSLSEGWAIIGGQRTELASFEIDKTLDPGEYWIELTMGNASTDNGVVGIRHSLLGDGSCYFAAPASGQAFALNNAAGYRLFGENVPGPGALAIFGVGLFTRGRRRRA